MLGTILWSKGRASFCRADGTGCAGGQSARAGGSWLLLLQLARSSAVQRHIIALEAELEPGL